MESLFFTIGGIHVLTHRVIEDLLAPNENDHFLPCLSRHSKPILTTVYNLVDLHCMV